MRTITREYIVYDYEELAPEAKERVKQFFLDNPDKNADFMTSCEEMLEENFPNSDLKPHYSLGSCQGDGFNIEGTVKLYDVLPKLEGFSEEEIKTLESYFEHMDAEFTFERNRNYAYSCKFIDKKYVDSFVADAVDNLENWFTVNKDLLIRFYGSMLDYFETLDKKFEKDGYKYLYEASDEDVREWCESNDYTFFANGELFDL